MAIYHFEAKIISRGTGRSAVAASAYLSCSQMYNEYDGIRHDYTRKGGLVFREVMLPANAPAAWNDRETLWNEVELTESTKDSRLAREIVVALPVELDKYANLELLRMFVQEAFVESGMCADYAIHDTDGHNPHAHVMLTMRLLNEDGTWQYKTEKEYLCIRNGEEKGFTAEEYKQASKEGWEKQYRYKVGRKKVYMTPAAAENEGYERVDKHPKATRFGRQNPISARWNSEEQLIAWRAQWAESVNRALERANKQERIDHRSNKDRGIDEQPTVHEGVSARIMEQKGISTERAELNRQIKADNKAIRELKATIARLLKGTKENLNIPAIAEALVDLRTNILHNLYRFTRIKKMLKTCKADIKEWEPDITRYYAIGEEIKDAKKELKKTEAETVKRKKKMSVIGRAADKVTAFFSETQEDNLTERIEELRSERKQILSRLHLHDAEEMKTMKHNLGVWKQNERTMEKVSAKCEDQMDADTKRYKELRGSVPGEQQPELEAACARKYQAEKYERRNRLEESYKGKEFDHEMYWDLEYQVETGLGIDRAMEADVRKQIELEQYRKHAEERDKQRSHKPARSNMER